MAPSGAYMWEWNTVKQDACLGEMWVLSTTEEKERKEDLQFGKLLFNAA